MNETNNVLHPQKDHECIRKIIEWNLTAHLIVISLKSQQQLEYVWTKDRIFIAEHFVETIMKMLNLYKQK